MIAHASLRSSARVLVVLAGLGCEAPASGSDAGVDGGSVDDAGPLPAVCASQHAETLDGVAIVVCDEAFPAAPFVHLPADSPSGTVETVYGGIGLIAPAVAGFLARGRTITSETTPPWAAAEGAVDNARYAYLLYRATVRAGVVEGVTPVVRIDDRVFARMIAGLVFEGGATPRMVDPSTGEVTFAFDDPSTPIRVRFATAPSDTETDRSRGFPRFELIGDIVNMTAAVTAADGACMASLESFGSANPFFGLDGQVVLLRYPGMHAPFIDVFTLAFDASDNLNMGEGLYLAPIDLLADTAPTLVDASTTPHLPPTAAPSATLDLVDGTMGGTTCTP